jgi:hypothetical protein
MPAGSIVSFKRQVLFFITLKSLIKETILRLYFPIFLAKRRNFRNNTTNTRSPITGIIKKSGICPP